MSCTFPVWLTVPGEQSSEAALERTAAQVSHSPIKSHLFWLGAYFTHLLEVGHFRHYILIFVERTEKSPAGRFRPPTLLQTQAKAAFAEQKARLQLRTQQFVEKTVALCR